MPYASEQDFIDLIGAQEALALTDLDNDGVADAGRMAAALSAASADIDGIVLRQKSYLQDNHADLLKTACIHFARWHLSGGSVTEVDPVKERRDYYTKLLRDLADGVSGNDGQGTAAAHGGEVFVSSSERVFTRTRRGL